MSCEDCAKPAAAEKGTFWAGEPAGKEVKLNGMSVYLAQPAEPTGKAVIMIPDVYGWDAKNARLYADKLAESGLTAALPDYFRDDPPDMGPVAKGDYTEFMKWRGRHGPDAVLPETEKVIGGLKADHGITSIGVVGFCWGGKFAAMLGTGDKVKAVVVNHGSFVEDDEVAGAKVPTMFNGSDNDRQISRERLAEIGVTLKDKAGVPSDVKLFEGAQHGWTVRGDDKDPELAPKILEAFERARDWFLKHL